MTLHAVTRRLAGLIPFSHQRNISRPFVGIIATTLVAGLAASHAQAATNPLKVGLKPPSKYQLDVLRVGKKLYIDRKDVFTDIPNRFNGMCYIRTANKDHAVRSDRFISLSTDKKSTVFVGFDARTKNLPDWMDHTWVKTGEKMSIQANYPQSMVIYRKHFPAGKIELGGSEFGLRTYVAFIKPRDGKVARTCKIVKHSAVKTKIAPKPPQKRLNLQVQKPAALAVDVLQANKLAYADRKFTISSVPKKYRGMCFIRPEDNNNYQAGKRALVFKTNKKVNVYVGFDSRISELPEWVNRSWKRTGHELGLKAVRDQKLVLYRKTFPAGQVALGGNEMGMRHYVTLVEDVSANAIRSCATPKILPVDRDSEDEKHAEKEKKETTTLTFSWQASRDYVKGYRVYQGSSSSKVNRLVSVIRLNNASFDPARPSVKFDAWKLLGNFAGEKTCFKVSAFDDTGESKKSKALCMKL